MSLRERHKDFAAELAESAMALARDVAQAALTAQAVAEKVALTQAHERLARSVRLSIQLCERLERAERDEADRSPGAAAPPLEALERRVEPQVALRKAQVRAAVRRSIEQDYEGEDAELLETALDIFVNEQALSREFMTRPAAEAVGQIRKGLRLREHPRLWPGGRAPGQPAVEAARPGQAGPS